MKMIHILESLFHFWKTWGFKNLIYYLLVTMLSFKCYVDHIYGHALINRFVLLRDFSDNIKICHLCWMVTVQKKENICIQIEESCGIRNKKTSYMVK